MPAYAKASDVEARLSRALNVEEKKLCDVLLEDAGAFIDGWASKASNDTKKIVSCRMVIRAIEAAGLGVPIGATQGSQSALSYTESWTLGGGGGAGELYLSKTDKQLLGIGEDIGATNPFAHLTYNTEVPI